MKLIRFGKIGEEVPGVIMKERYYDFSEFFEDYNEEFFESGGLDQLAEMVSYGSSHFKEVSKDVRLGSPVTRPSKIVCIGLNYADHAKETGATSPPEPVIFLKSSSALSGPNDDIILPKHSTKTDWEVELGVVISKKASYVDEQHALDYVAGYCLHNDVSEREFQLERNGTWDKGKGCDTFAPIGPFLASKEELIYINNLRLWLTVNGRKMQEGNTSNLIFKIPFLVSYVSQFMTLLPGDIISTGTPAGVGLGMKPPVYLKAGDVVELGIDGLGTSKQLVKAYGNN